VEDAAGVLPVGPWALAAVATVLVVALSVPPGGPRPATVGSRPGPLAGRVGAVLCLLAPVAAAGVARLGPASELRNPVPALVVGLGWPLLLLLPGLVGLLRRLPDEATDPPRVDARPAAVAALAVVSFLVLPAAPTRPLAVAVAVAAYALVVAAACVAFGRRPVAERFEVLGLLARWGAVGRALPRWAAPRGALAALAVVLAGGWFERYERTSAWNADLPGSGDTVVGLGTALVLAGLAAAALHRGTRSGAPGTAAAVLLPLALATAAAGVARRALISAQLLLDQAVGGRPVDPDPLGVAGGQALALGLVVLGGALSGAVLARRMGEASARLPGLAVLLVLTGASAWVVLQP
jgi:hypothetical protein